MTANGLCVINIRKRYHRQDFIWQDVSFVLNQGETLGITGSNGAGKSTLLRVLATLEKPDAGSIQYLSEDVLCKQGRKAYRSILGYVPQDIILYPELSSYENLQFFGRANHVEKAVLTQRIWEIAEAVQLSKEVLKKKTGWCSGGQKRRLNLAAALLHEPQILLLDEPVAGIDEESVQVILQELQNRRDKGAAIIYVGHEEQELATICTRRARLEKGKWIEHGTIGKC